MISTRSLEKPIPHPILDDSSKMMRIIGKFIELYLRNNFVISFTYLANPLYDKLTLSRAAQIRTHTPLESIQQSRQLNRSRERSTRTSFKPEDIEQTTTTVYFF